MWPHFNRQQRIHTWQGLRVLLGKVSSRWAQMPPGRQPPGHHGRTCFNEGLMEKRGEIEELPPCTGKILAFSLFFTLNSFWNFVQWRAEPTYHPVPCESFNLWRQPSCRSPSGPTSLCGAENEPRAAPRALGGSAAQHSNDGAVRNSQPCSHPCCCSCCWDCSVLVPETWTCSQS